MSGISTQWRMLLCLFPNEVKVSYLFNVVMYDENTYNLKGKVDYICCPCG